MPTSDAQGKDVALAWYEKIRPATAVDVGAGCGTYARLMRPAHRGYWRAVEAWAPYVEAFGLRDLYDEVMVCDVLYLDQMWLGSDLVIAGDVLEHMQAPIARTLIRRFQDRAVNVIVSIPVLHLDQGAVNGNPYERHVDHWTAEAMAAELRDGLVEQWVGDVLAYFWWSRGEVDRG